MMTTSMQKLLKVMMTFVVTVFLIGGGTYVYFVVIKLSQKVNFQEVEIRLKLTELSEKIDRLQLSVDRMGNSYQGLSDGLLKLEDEQGLMKDRVEYFVGDIDQLKLSIGNQMNGLMRVVHGLQDQSKQWIKEGVSTLALFESNLDANNKDVTDIIRTQLPELNKKLGEIKNQQQEDRAALQGVKTKTTSLSILEGKMTDLEKQLSTLQEKTLDVILKSDVLRKF